MLRSRGWSYLHVGRAFRLYEKQPATLCWWSLNFAAEQSYEAYATTFRAFLSFEQATSWLATKGRKIQRHSFHWICSDNCRTK